MGGRPALMARRLLPNYVGFTAASAGLPAFSQRFVASYAYGSRCPFLSVLNNYQEVAPGSRLHEALREGLEEIPPGVRIAILSRSDPPSEFARHRANQALTLLEWDALN